MEALAGWVGGQPVYKQASRTAYDAYGRVVESYDALDRKTSTAYTPAAGGPATAMTVNDPINFATTTTLEPAWS